MFVRPLIRFVLLQTSIDWLVCVGRLFVCSGMGWNEINARNKFVIGKGKKLASIWHVVLGKAGST